MPKKIACLLAACVLTGCSTYADQNISSVQATGSVLGNDVSHFCQHASYATKESVYRGSAVLSHLMGFWQYGQQVSLVKFTSSSKDAFSTEFLDKQLNVLGARHFSRGTDYQEQADGSVDIQVSSRCGSGGGPGIGCTSSSVRMFTDQAGKLAVIQETGGAGIAGIVPVSTSASYLSLFPPVTVAGGSPQAGLASCPESRAAMEQAEIQQQRVTPTFAVGDVVVPYRRYDRATNAFLLQPAPYLKNTKWRVQEITPKHVRLELIEGEYQPLYPKGAIYQAGQYSTNFFSSDNYKAARPHAGNLGQIFEEFRKQN